MKTILGTGRLGQEIMKQLLKNNPAEEIILVNRKGKTSFPLPSNVQVMAADVTDHDQLENIARLSDIIFSCTDMPYQNWASFYPAAANALAYALSRTNARLVFADNMYSYGNVKGAEMNEAGKHTASTKKGMIRAAVINTLLHTDKNISSRVAFVKAADFIGPAIHKGLFGTDFLERLYHNKTIMLSGNIKLPHSFTYITDFADAMINVAQADDAYGQVWHVPNAPAISPAGWIKLFEEETGRKAKIMLLPKFAVRLVGIFNPLIKEFYELAYQFEYPYIVRHCKYADRFCSGFTGHLSVVKVTVSRYEQSLHKYH